ncbi:hypothetical protein FA13DRAFT_1845893 [Coprinellus micaceus]|uniref:Uncharacterized protein n=1 Tax=Coprinellus micaceus TaxID=71717 RepID=A0A4Y7TAU6_COPMI|nr:hypothetical protein FA13DRAFT_1845893 [Coprinellus micaceus]
MSEPRHRRQRFEWVVWLWPFATSTRKEMLLLVLKAPTEAYVAHSGGQWRSSREGHYGPIPIVQAIEARRGDAGAAAHRFLYISGFWGWVKGPFEATQPPTPRNYTVPTISFWAAPSPRKGFDSPAKLYLDFDVNVTGTGSTTRMNIFWGDGKHNELKYMVQDDALGKPLLDTPVTWCDLRQIWRTPFFATKVSESVLYGNQSCEPPRRASIATAPTDLDKTHSAPEIMIKLGVLLPGLDRWTAVKLGHGDWGSILAEDLGTGCRALDAGPPSKAVHHITDTLCAGADSVDNYLRLLASGYLKRRQPLSAIGSIWSQGFPGLDRAYAHI